MATLAIIIQSRLPEESRQISRLAMFATGLVLLCYLAVPFTDQRYWDYIHSGKGLNPQDLSGLIGIMEEDFVRHMTSGVKETTRLIHSSWATSPNEPE